MEKEHDRAEYEQSLSAWRGRLRAANQRPLIDSVTNSWRDDEKAAAYTSESENHEPGFCDIEDDDSCPNLSRRAIRSRRFWKMLAAFVLLAVVLYYAWKRYVRPQLQEEWDLKEGFLPAKTNGTYGFARGGDFEGTLIRDLDPELMPGGSADPDGKRRLVFVGDIHGCRKELLELLDNVNFNPKLDHLIATGDVLSKGPDSPGVLDELMRLHAESVRGNHEDRLLEAARTLLATDSPPESPPATSQGHSKDRALLKHLRRKHINFLRSMPLVLRIPALPQATAAKRKHADHLTEDILVVHAGLVPHVPLLRQDPYFVMNMRSIDHITHIPSALRETKKGRSRPWFDIWNWYNDRLARGRPIKDFHVYTYADWLANQVPEGWLSGLRNALGGLSKVGKLKPQVAVYGHDSKAGLQMHRWSKGLDSGCVSGGQLTAMVLDAKGETRIVQVGCKNYR